MHMRMMSSCQATIRLLVTRLFWAALVKGESDLALASHSQSLAVLVLFALLTVAGSLLGNGGFPTQPIPAYGQLVLWDLMRLHSSRED